MTKTCRVLGVVAIGFAMIAFLAVLGQSQERRDTTQSGSLSHDRGLRQQSPGQMSLEEKLVRDAYARLMRYHTAWLDELAATTERATTPDDYVVFEVRNVVTGRIEEIYDRPLAEMVTAPGTEFVRVAPHHLRYGNGPQHAYYEVEWADGSATSQGDDKMTVQQMLTQASGQLGNTAIYVSYEVTVRLKRKERTYRALAFVGSKIRSTGKHKTEMMDQITTEMNSVLVDQSPRVRSPWKAYTKSGLYLAVAWLIRHTLKDGKPLIPPGAPVGYLPGDDLAEEGSALSLVAEPCVACVVPSGETTSSGGWEPGFQTFHLFNQTLTPETVNFAGRYVDEQNPGGGTDTCWFPDSIL